MSGSATSNNKPFYLRKWFIITAGVVILGSIGSALGLGTDDQTNSLSAVSDVTFESKGCLEVSPGLVAGIGEGFAGSKLTGKAAGFVAPDFADVKFVSVEFIPNGDTEPQIAVFATNDDLLSDETVNGLIIPADGFAKEFSDWGENKKLNLSIADKGASESKECIALIK